MTNFLKPRNLILRLIILLILLISVAVIGRLVVNLLGIDTLTKPNNVSSIGEVENGTGVPSVFKEIAKPVYFPPVTLMFKDKTLSVEEIGVEEGGILGVPSSWYTVGWYSSGAKVGEEGNVIIDGHYDTNTGAPGAFWELKDIQIGDTVSLTDSLGRVFKYIVLEKSSISITDPERSKVFESSKGKMLTLITCGGVWDYASGTYNQRLVIRAEFAKMEKAW